MFRTEAQQAAYKRDKGLCIWHLWRHEMRVPAPDVHHIARRGEGRDTKDLCVSLCRQCHVGEGRVKGHHQGGSPSTYELLNMMLDFYGIDLRREFPQFFRGQ